MTDDDEVIGEAGEREREKEDKFFIPFEELVFGTLFVCLSVCLTYLSNQKSKEREVTQGGFGMIYKGEYLGLPVCIKKFLFLSSSDDKKLIRREIGTIQQLPPKKLDGKEEKKRDFIANFFFLCIAVLKGIRHPNIVTFIGISRDEKDGSLYLITEWLENGDINSLVKVQCVCLSVCGYRILSHSFSQPKSLLFPFLS